MNPINALTLPTVDKESKRLLEEATQLNLLPPERMTKLCELTKQLSALGDLVWSRSINIVWLAIELGTIATPSNAAGECFGLLPETVRRLARCIIGGTPVHVVPCLQSKSKRALSVCGDAIGGLIASYDSVADPAHDSSQSLTFTHIPGTPYLRLSSLKHPKLLTFVGRSGGTTRTDSTKPDPAGHFSLTVDPMGKSFCISTEKWPEDVLYTSEWRCWVCTCHRDSVGAAGQFVIEPANGIVTVPVALAAIATPIVNNTIPSSSAGPAVASSVAAPAAPPQPVTSANGADLYVELAKQGFATLGTTVLSAVRAVKNTKFGDLTIVSMNCTDVTVCAVLTEQKAPALQLSFSGFTMNGTYGPNSRSIGVTNLTFGVQIPITQAPDGTVTIDLKVTKSNLTGLQIVDNTVADYIITAITNLIGSPALKIASYVLSSIINTAFTAAQKDTHTFSLPASIQNGPKVNVKFRIVSVDTTGGGFRVGVSVQAAFK